MVTSKSGTNPTATCADDPAPSSATSSTASSSTGPAVSPRTHGPSLPVPCAVASVEFALPVVDPPMGLISRDRVLGAGSLLLAYRYGDQLRFFEAVGRARELLDTDQLCLNDLDRPAAYRDSPATSRDEALLDRLYCWPELENRVSTATRRRLAAKVFGIPHPDVPDDERDTGIQPMLVRLLDAINEISDLDSVRTAPTPLNLYRLEFAARTVQARLSLSMTGLVTMQVRDLQRQLTASMDILTELASRLQLPCRPGATGRDMWDSLEMLVGNQLRADGVDLFEAADMAAAWRVVFQFLANFTGGASVSAELREAAAVLRPPASDRIPVGEQPRQLQPQ